VLAQHPGSGASRWLPLGSRILLHRARRQLQSASFPGQAICEGRRRPSRPSALPAPALRARSLGLPARQGFARQCCGGFSAPRRSGALKHLGPIARSRGLVGFAVCCFHVRPCLQRTLDGAPECARLRQMAIIRRSFASGTRARERGRRRRLECPGVAHRTAQGERKADVPMGDWSLSHRRNWTRRLRFARDGRMAHPLGGWFHPWTGRRARCVRRFTERCAVRWFSLS